MEPISYLCNTVPNLDKMKRNLEVIIDFVDNVVICIGRRDEEAEAYLKSCDKVSLSYFPWEDSFRDSYQACLNMAPPGWHLRLDDDEVPSLGMLGSLRAIITESTMKNKFDVVEFNCVGVDDGVMGEPGEGYRELFYRWNPDLRYRVSLHQSLHGYKHPKVRCKQMYYHHKSKLGGFRGSCRNFFIAGVWGDTMDSFWYWHHITGQDPRLNVSAPLVPEKQGIAFPLQDGFRIDSWHDMKDILRRNHPEVKYFMDLDELICSGEICSEFVDWAENHSAANDLRPYLNELHAFDMYIKGRAA